MFDVVKKYANDAVWASIPYVTRAGLGFLVAVIFAHFSSKEIFGEYQFIMSVVAILSVFSLTGMNSAMIQSIAKGYDRSLSDGVRYQIKYSFFGALILLLICIYLWFLDSVSYKYYFIASIFFPFYYSLQNSTCYHIGKNRLKECSLLFSFSLFVAYLPLILAVIFSDSLSLIIFSNMFSMVVAFLFYYVYTKKTNSDSIVLSNRDPLLLIVGVSMSFVQFVPIVASYLDKILLTAFLGFEELAIYVIALAIPQQSKIVLAPLVNIVLPRLSAHPDLKIAYRAVKQKLWLLMGLSILFVSAGILFTPILIHAFFSASYVDAIFLSQLAFLGYLFAFYGQILYNFLEAGRKTRSLHKANILPELIRYSAFMLLVPFFGLIGAVVSLIISKLVNLIYLVILTERELKS